MVGIHIQAAAVLLLGASASAMAAPYRPVSDAVIGPIKVAPKTAAEVTAQCDARLAALKSHKARVEAMPVSTEPATLLAAYDDLYNIALTTAYAEPSVIKETNPDAAIRKAGEDCVQKGSAGLVQLTMSRPLYERLQTVEQKGVDPSQRYMLARQLASYRRAGVDKDAATRARITALQDRITAATLEFESNIAADKRTLTARADEMRGLPKDWLDAHPAGADGTIQIGMAYPEVTPLFRYAESADLRRRAMTVFNNRGYPSNDGVLKRIIADRAELAHLLGFETYAAYDFGNRMAADPKRVRAFLEEIGGVARPIGAGEAQRMLARLQKDDPSLRTLGSWSTNYSSRLIRKEDYDVDPQVIRQYLRFDKVLGGIHRLTQDLFEVQIRPWATEVWHPDVRPFEIVDKGKVIGRFYLDMHAREGKFTHAQMSVVRIGIKDRVLPVAVLETNFPKGFMEHGEVVTYLHEFGHLLHWIFSGQRPFAAQNAIELENDVIEAPSQLLEEWVWDYETLKRFATNDAGEPIPAALVERMNAGRRFGQAFGTMSQLGLAAVALDFYSDPQPTDLAAAYGSSYGRYSLVPEPEGAHSYASFGHLTGYAASYYTYQWSKALASDLFSRFRAAGLRDTATANAYRQMVLAPGGSDSMNLLARNFLGRDWSVASYRAELELGAPAAAAATATPTGR